VHTHTHTPLSLSRPCKVVKVMPAFAIVETPSSEFTGFGEAPSGLLHISEVAHGRVDELSEVR
jgi:predicted RNA-binding protein with RPS1 domain